MGKERMSVHVCLVSEQPIPNLITIRQFRPDEVILISTKEMATQKKRLAAIVEKWGSKVAVLDTEPYDIGRTMELCEQLVATRGTDDLSLNVTGGTKIAAAASTSVR